MGCRYHDSRHAGHCEVLSRGHHVRQGHWPLCCLGRVRDPFDEGTSYADRMRNRYLPAGVLDENFNISDPDESKITEYVGHSWYEGDADLPPFEQDTKPAFTEYDVNDRYTWDKCPLYDGKSPRPARLLRVLVAYKRGVPFVKQHVDEMLVALGAQGWRPSVLQNTLGRTGARQVETLYIATLMKEWVNELCEAIKSGDSEYFRAPEKSDGEGTAFWEAPRGALYHSEKVKGGKITGLPDHHSVHVEPLSARPEEGNYGPLEQALIGVPLPMWRSRSTRCVPFTASTPCAACAYRRAGPARSSRP